VDQYSLNDRRALPKDGVPVSNIQANFRSTWVYGYELGGLTYRSDYAETAPYPYYDRWCDDWNVSTEGSTTDTARGFASTAWLGARTSAASQPWRSTNATIIVPSTARLPGQPVNVSLTVADSNLNAARIIWEAFGQEPTFGGQNYTFVANSQGVYWIEAEVQCPDGRRAFATNSISISTNAAPVLTNPTKTSGAFSFILAGTPMATYIIQVSPNLTNWTSLATNTLPSNGLLTVTDSQAPSFTRRYYRALKSS